MLACYNLPYPRVNTWYNLSTYLQVKARGAGVSRSALAGKLETILGSKEQPETLKKQNKYYFKIRLKSHYRVHDLSRVFLVFYQGSIGFGSTHEIASTGS